GEFHDATSDGWMQVTANVSVPINIDGIKVGARVGTAITSGTVWADDISALVQQDFVTGLEGMLSALIKGLLKAIVELPGNILEWLGIDFDNFLTRESPLNALHLFNQIPPGRIGFVPFSAIGDDKPNLLTTPGFDTIESIDGATLWQWDGVDGRTSPGCAYTEANGEEKKLLSNQISASE